MRKIGILLIAIVALMVIGCQPPEGMGGVTAEQFDELKTNIESLKTDMTMLRMAVDSLTEHYNMHVEKFHKGGTKAPTPKKKEAPPPVQK